MKENPPGAPRAHSLSMENRTRAVVTGVEDVELFSEHMIVAVTSQGTLTMAGQALHVESLDLTEGKLVAEGQFEAMEYDERAKKTKGAFSKIFR